LRIHFHFLPFFKKSSTGNAIQRYAEGHAKET
jgi:hypothetical protein